MARPWIAKGGAVFHNQDQGKTDFKAGQSPGRDAQREESEGSSARIGLPALDPEEVRRFHENALVADIHAHPSLKTFLFGKELDRAYKAPPYQFPFTLRTNIPSLKAGSVNVMLATTHLPERDLRGDAWPLKIVAKFWKKLDRIFKEPADSLTRESLQGFEDAVAAAAKRSGEFVRVVKSHAELQQCLAEKKLAMIHAIEGAHSLNGKLENVEDFFKRGVCMLTIAHFYDNELTGSAGGIPKDLWLKKIGILKKPFHPEQGLTDFGRDVIQKMIELGMLIDLVHTSPVGRAEIVELNKNRRPLIMSHTGVRKYMDDPLNVSDGEIRAIADSGGVVGVIAMNHWLIGKDGKDGIDFMVRTVEHIANVGGEDCLALGSDFDGFTNPPNDLKEPADLPKFTAALLKRFPPRVVEKALGGNFMRALKAGWDKYQ